MTCTDPIAEFATGIRNAQVTGKEYLTWDHTNMLESIAKILEKNGFIEKVEIIPDSGSRRFLKKLLRIHLRYLDEHRREPMITSIQRVSRPGRRVYRGYSELKPVRGGTGVNIVSTSRGILSDVEARRRKLGGEVLLEIF